ncbi:uroporphyrinogen-III C-methyltransferase [Kineobactrum sediminis]|uniref:Siroheme synthase n=1 Tax=Kineobactrum sediminis TaxID=1905677 RepID=A0A2N5Y368_9GAMM|nr:siroheme synthase CysG [Kineobactrum sediminis]PLW82833.1 uroporphyrinogen-III C-methyltransferase [Kineobactrum sediminis]
METLPLFLKLDEVCVVLIGGGQVATRKARLLVSAGAALTVIAPEITPELQDLLGLGTADVPVQATPADNRHQWLPEPYAGVEQLLGARLVIVATPDRAVNALVSEQACAHNILVNVVDSPALCTFLFPAIVDRSPLVIAIGSNGGSPVLARQVRRRIEAMVPATYGRLAAFARRLRTTVATALPDVELRRRFWEQIIDGPIAGKVLSGREAEASVDLETLLQAQQHNPETLTHGEVYLIGAGPGDPDLMTFKALRLLQAADVVLYDRLVNPLILDMARRDADRIYVGKRRAEHSVPQPAINQQLLELARQGRRVARLKGGDPFIFGRGGEEIELLAEHGIPFQVVPGITAASGAACYAGIPLTHRDYAQSVRFVAGHLKAGQEEHDWQAFSSPTETLVFYMGLSALDKICQQLQAHGRSPTTPVAVIERATLPEQRILVGTLDTIEDIVAAARPTAHTLIIVGEVVRLQRDLYWFGNTPANGS